VTAAAALPFNPTAGRIQNAAVGKPDGEATNAADGGQESFATVLAGTTQTTDAAEPGAAPAAAVTPAAPMTANASTQFTKLITTTTGDIQTAEPAAESVIADPSPVVPVAATQPTIVTATTPIVPHLSGTALVVDTETGDAATPVDGAVEDPAPVPSAMLAATTGVVAGVPAAAANTAATQAAAVATEATTTIPTLIDAAKVEADATIETLDAAEGDGAATTATANSQTPAKASAHGVATSPASATNPTAAAAPDLQAAAVDPAAGAQAKAAATVDALVAAAPAPHEAARASATNTAAQTAAPAATMQVYTRMIERFDGRAQRFEIRLDPAELGRVDVRIEIGADKKVHAVLAAHDSAALNDLMRGQRALERALANAGIDLADGGVKFELANDSGRNASTGDGEGRSPFSRNVWRNFEVTNPSAEAAAKPVEQPWRPSRLDLVA
jgi:chemotaxis protein MotD